MSKYSTITSELEEMTNLWHINFMDQKQKLLKQKLLVYFFAQYAPFISTLKPISQTKMIKIQNVIKNIIKKKHCFT